MVCLTGSALDELVDSLESALTSVDSSLEVARRTVGSVVVAHDAAVAFGREQAVADTDQLRIAVKEATATLAAARDTYASLQDHAIALRDGEGSISDTSRALDVGLGLSECSDTPPWGSMWTSPQVLR